MGSLEQQLIKFKQGSVTSLPLALRKSDAMLCSTGFAVNRAACAGMGKARQAL